MVITYDLSDMELLLLQGAENLTVLILNVIPRSSAAIGTRHSNKNHIEHDSHEMPRSSAAIGSFTF
jgi:hypothetical protein